MNDVTSSNFVTQIHPPYPHTHNQTTSATNQCVGTHTTTLVSLLMDKRQQAPPLLENLVKQGRTLWSKSTWEQRDYLFRRFLNSAEYSAPALMNLPLQLRACAFVANIPRLKPSSRVNYTSSLKAILDALGHPTPDMALYSKAIRSGDTDNEINQALPLTYPHFTQILHALCRTDAYTGLAFWIAWKTASRWADVLALTRRNFIHISENEIILHFGNLTKSTKLSPFDQRTLTVIHDTGSMIQVVQLLSRLPLATPLTTWTTEKLGAFAQDVTKVHYTAHSIKRGSLLHLLHRIETQDLTILPILAKHASPELIPSSTIRYLSGDLAQLARLLGTQKLTVLL